MTKCEVDESWFGLLARRKWYPTYTGTRTSKAPWKIKVLVFDIRPLCPNIDTSTMACKILQRPTDTSGLKIYLDIVQLSCHLKSDSFSTLSPNAVLLLQRFTTASKKTILNASCSFTFHNAHLHLRVNFWPAITGAAAVDFEFAFPHMAHAFAL